MRYVTSRFSLFDREETYRIYVTKALQLFGKLNISYIEMLNKKPPEEEESGEEVIKRISAKLDALGGK